MYCTQNNYDCQNCSLANYGKDCHNNQVVNRIWLTGQVLGDDVVIKYWSTLTHAEDYLSDKNYNKITNMDIRYEVKATYNRQTPNPFGGDAIVDIAYIGWREIEK
jgi:acetyltransferase-like isoleucine patch superfamily enzyme